MKKSLRLRILDAEPGILVAEVVSPEILSRLPQEVAREFQNMRIAWGDNRSWGTNFQLGERVVTLGHRRGDHVAMHPEVHGLTEQQGEEFLRKQVEGTCLHELGHAVFDRALFAQDQNTMLCVTAANDTDGPVSTYTGMVLCRHREPCPQMSKFDRLHETVAEAFRWWVASPEYMECHFPTWSYVVPYLLHHVK